ncbi:MAG: DUF951 domain-containing protein [SAR202 cluster bacterium]|nr:DUF951 domain-containing protein [SAR202 cluster bacterium]
MATELHLGDVVRLRKPHPCGSFDWEVTRLGADIRVRCLSCERTVMLSRSDLSKRTRSVVSKGQTP